MKMFAVIAVSMLFGQLAFADSTNVCVNARSGALTIARTCPKGTVKATVAGLAPRSIPSGATVYGVIGGRYYAHAQGDSFDSYSSLPLKTTPAFDSETDVQVAHTFACPAGGSCLTAEEADVSDVCTGTAAQPTAPAGKVCIYPSIVGNARFLIGFNLVDGMNPTPNGAIPAAFAAGFGLGWEASGAGDSYVQAVWAYHAP